MKTDDGSFTLYSAAYGEGYHSLSGAVSEAFSKYIVPCGIAELAKRGSVRLLDVGFGLGYNLLAAIHTARDASPECRIEVVTLEKDILPVSSIDALTLPEILKPYSEIVLSTLNVGCYEDETLSVTLLPGDARKAIFSVDGPFDAVFLDPFSPKKNPELWTVEFFQQLYARMTDEAILATYSAATPVRCGLLEAGFRIAPGPGDKMKRGGTLATKESDIIPLSERERARLARSPEATPYYDPEGSFSREEIVELRERYKSHE